MKNKHFALLGIALVSLLLSCYPHKNIYVDEYDIVGTAPDKQFDFSTHKTYALPDSIILVDGDAYKNKKECIDQTTANLILGQIRMNLDAYGWVEKDTSVADIILLPSVFKNTTISYYYDYAYWGWYYPGYYPGYGWGYPGGAMTYRKGIEAGSVPVVWTGLINGLLNTGSSTSSVNTRIKKNIDQAFKQSEYLK
jgi:Domain of unknown function (DUF4136)